MKKITKFLNLAKGIFNYNVTSHFAPLKPTEMQINITYKCNSRCQMCQIWKNQPKDEMNLSEWSSILEDPIFLKINRLMIAGGEPFLAPNLNELIRIFTKKMPELKNIFLVTNGFLSDQIQDKVEEIIKELKKKKIDLSISVSLDGLDKKHDELRGVPNAFRKTEKTILALKKLKRKHRFFLGVSGVICRANLNEIQKVEEWCKKNDLPFSYQLIGFHETYVQNLKQESLLGFRKKDKEELLKLISKLGNIKSKFNLRKILQAYYWKDMYGLYQGKKRITPCPFLYDAFVLDSFGDVYYCLSEQRIGNCRSGKSVGELYYDKRSLLFRKKLSESKCAKCNSACLANSAVAKDFKRLAIFALTNRLWGWGKK